MPLTRISIEQLSHNRWVAEVEAGGTHARRINVTGITFDDLFLKVHDVYKDATAPRPTPVVTEELPAAEETSEEETGEEETGEKNQTSMEELFGSGDPQTSVGQPRKKRGRR